MHFYLMFKLFINVKVIIWSFKQKRHATGKKNNCNNEYTLIISKKQTMAEDCRRPIHNIFYAHTWSIIWSPGPAVHINCLSFKIKCYAQLESDRGIICIQWKHHAHILMITFTSSVQTVVCPDNCRHIVS